MNEDKKEIKAILPNVMMTEHDVADYLLECGFDMSRPIQVRSDAMTLEVVYTQQIG